MPLYTFYLHREDGTAPTFEVHEQANDNEAHGKAIALLEDHGSCAYVAIWVDERFVEHRHRDEPMVRALRPLGETPDAEVR